MGTMQVPAAPEARWQMGKVERKSGFPTEMPMPSFTEREVEGPTTVKPTVPKMAQAFSQLVTHAGFSPNPWVLGPGWHLSPGELGHRRQRPRRDYPEC